MIQQNSSHIGPSEGVENILLFYTLGEVLCSLMTNEIESASTSFLEKE